MCVCVCQRNLIRHRVRSKSLRHCGQFRQQNPLAILKQEGLVELERRCQSFRADVEYLCEREEVLKDLVVSKKDMQRTAPEDCQRTIRGVEGFRGTEGKRSFDTRAKEAQVD